MIQPQALVPDRRSCSSILEVPEGLSGGVDSEGGQGTKQNSTLLTKDH